MPEKRKREVQIQVRCGLYQKDLTRYSTSLLYALQTRQAKSFDTNHENNKLARFFFKISL